MVCDGEHPLPYMRSMVFRRSRQRAWVDTLSSEKLAPTKESPLTIQYPSICQAKRMAAQVSINRTGTISHRFLPLPGHLICRITFGANLLGEKGRRFFAAVSEPHTIELEANWLSTSI